MGASCGLFSECLPYFLAFICYPLCYRFPIKEGCKEDGIRVSDLDQACSNLVDVGTLVIRLELVLGILGFQEFLKGIPGEDLDRVVEEGLGILLISQDDGLTITCDGVDSQGLMESESSVWILCQFLGGEGEGGECEGDDGDNLFHMSKFMQYLLLGGSSYPVISFLFCHIGRNSSSTYWDQ